jgi:hypothetical protein
MINCPLKLEVGCQYGVNLKCPSDYEECSFYQLNQRQTQMNAEALIQIQASDLELKLRAKIEEAKRGFRDV